MFMRNFYVMIWIYLFKMQINQERKENHVCDDVTFDAGQKETVSAKRVLFTNTDTIEVRGPHLPILRSMDATHDVEIGTIDSKNNSEVSSKGIMKC